MKLLLGSTGFKLTKWSFNDTDILRHIDSTDLAPAIRNITGEEIFQPGKERQKTFGLAWYTNTDQIFVKKPDFDRQNSCPLTMRCNHQLFDPLGLWSPLYVKMNLWCSKIMRSMTGETNRSRTSFKFIGSFSVKLINSNTRKKLFNE